MEQPDEVRYKKKGANLTQKKGRPGRGEIERVETRSKGTIYVIMLGGEKGGETDSNEGQKLRNKEK